MLKMTAAILRTMDKRLTQLEQKISKSLKLEEEATRLRNAISVLRGQDNGAGDGEATLDGGGVLHVRRRRGRKASS